MHFTRYQEGVAVHLDVRMVDVWPSFLIVDVMVHSTYYLLNIICEELCYNM